MSAMEDRSDEVPTLSEITIHETLDATGLKCPMPLLKTKLSLNAMPEESILLVKATDPGSKRDFAVYIQMSPHTLINQWEDGTIYHYLIQVGSK